MNFIPGCKLPTSFRTFFKPMHGSPYTSVMYINRCNAFAFKNGITMRNGSTILNGCQAHTECPGEIWMGKPPHITEYSIPSKTVWLRPKPRRPYFWDYVRISVFDYRFHSDDV